MELAEGSGRNGGELGDDAGDLRGAVVGGDEDEDAIGRGGTGPFKRL